MGTGTKERRYYTKEVMRLCNVTRKQLLYYEEKGLISPVLRDENNNYRYYTQLNITQIFIINEYLSFGYKLDEIHKILFENDVSAMKDYVNERMHAASEDFAFSVLQYEQSMQKYTQLWEGLTVLELYLSMGKEYSPASLCKIYELPKQQIIAIDSHGSPFEEINVAQAGISPLYTMMKRYQLKSMGPLQYHFYGIINKEENRFVEGDVKMLRAFPVVSRYSVDCVKTVEAQKCASAIHIGNWDSSLKDTYQTLLNWCKEQGLEVTGDSIEQYLIGAEMTNNVDLYVTRI